MIDSAAFIDAIEASGKQPRDRLLFFFDRVATITDGIDPAQLHSVRQELIDNRDALADAILGKDGFRAKT